MKMTKKRLENLRALKQELETLQKRYITMPSCEEVGDTAGDYRTGKKRIIQLQGVSNERYKQLGKKIYLKSEQLANEIEELEHFLDDVEDSQMRNILRLYYAEGYTLEEVGEIVGYTSSNIWAKINKFFGKDLKNFKK